MKEYVESREKEDDKLVFNSIRNSDLVCKDCESRYVDSVIKANVSTCSKFTTKPDQVLKGGNCSEYKRQKD